MNKKTTSNHLCAQIALKLFPLLILLFTGVSSAHAAPTLNPSSGTVSATGQVFTFNPNGTVVQDWWVYIGTAAGRRDLYDSGSLGAAASSVTAPNLPSSTIYFTLWYKVAGAWQKTGYVLSASSSGGVSASDRMSCFDANYELDETSTYIPSSLPDYEEFNIGCTISCPLNTIPISTDCSAQVYGEFPIYDPDNMIFGTPMAVLTDVDSNTYQCDTATISQLFDLNAIGNETVDYTRAIDLRASARCLSIE